MIERLARLIGLGSTPQPKVEPPSQNLPAIIAQADFEGISIIAVKGGGLHYSRPDKCNGNFEPVPPGGKIDLGDGRILTIKQTGSGLSINCSSKNGGGVRVSNMRVSGDIVATSTPQGSTVKIRGKLE